jgi:transcriptional regulator with XRE-family HTH domain
VRELAENVATARTRREWRQADLADKAGVSRPTIARLETGDLGISIGAYAAVLFALGLEGQLAAVAAPSRDPEGEALAAARLGQRVRPAGTLDDDF